jgi:hypothetical protein
MAAPVLEIMDTPSYISLFSGNMTKIAHLQKYQHFNSGNTASFQKFFKGSVTHSYTTTVVHSAYMNI